MRRSLAPFSGSDLSIHTRSLADFITITSGFRFSVHTGLKFLSRQVILDDNFRLLATVLTSESSYLGF